MVAAWQILKNDLLRLILQDCCLPAMASIEATCHSWRQSVLSDLGETRALKLLGQCSDRQQSEAVKILRFCYNLRSLDLRGSCIGAMTQDSLGRSLASGAM